MSKPEATVERKSAWDKGENLRGSRVKRETVLFWVTQISEISVQCCEKVFFPFQIFLFLFLAYLTHLNDSDHEVNLQKNNLSKYKTQFLNDDFIKAV